MGSCLRISWCVPGLADGDRGMVSERGLKDIPCLVINYINHFVLGFNRNFRNVVR